MHRKQATATDQEDVLVLKLRRRATYYRKYVRRADTPQTGRGDAAAAGWIVRGPDHPRYGTDNRYIIIPVILFVLVSYSSFYVARAAAPARVGLTLIAFLVITNFNASVLNRIPPVDYDVRLLNFLSFAARTFANESRRRRGCNVDIPWRRVAAATWIFRRARRRYMSMWFSAFAIFEYAVVTIRVKIKGPVALDGPQLDPEFDFRTGQHAV